MASAAVLLGPSGDVEGFGSVHERTGRGTAFVEAEVSTGPGRSERQATLLAFVVERLAPSHDLRKVFLRLPSDEPPPRPFDRLVREARIPDLVAGPSGPIALDVFGIEL